MHKRLTRLLLGLLLALVLGSGIVVASSTWQSSANYAVPWDVLSAGGGEMASTNYALDGTVGQPSIGPVSSSSYAIGGGYWVRIGGTDSMEVYLPLVVR